MVQVLFTPIFSNVFVFNYRKNLFVERQYKVCLLRKLANPKTMVQLEKVVLVLHVCVDY